MLLRLSLGLRGRGPLGCGLGLRVGGVGSRLGLGLGLCFRFRLSRGVGSRLGLGRRLRDCLGVSLGGQLGRCGLGGLPAGGVPGVGALLGGLRAYPVGQRRPGSVARPLSAVAPAGSSPEKWSRTLNEGLAPVESESLMVAARAGVARPIAPVAPTAAMAASPRTAEGAIPAGRCGASGCTGAQAVDWYDATIGVLLSFPSADRVS